jgi:hypothetical protein
VHRQKQTGLQLDRRGRSRSAAVAGERCAGWPRSPATRRRRYPAHGLAEPADLRRAGRRDRAGPRRHRSYRPLQRGQLGQARACRLHRQQRAASSRVRYQAGTPRTSPAGATSRVALDGPSTSTSTGCHHSCAQHYIGDIGLLACKIATSEAATRSRAITSWSAAASGPMPGSAAKWPAT